MKMQCNAVLIQHALHGMFLKVDALLMPALRGDTDTGSSDVSPKPNTNGGVPRTWGLSRNIDLQLS
eukprot:6455782-Amphidinium_carterae.1